MEMAAKVKTELAFSGLFRVVSILEENFRDVINTEEMKRLNDFVDCEIEVLTREAQPDDLVQLMSSLKELQAAALKTEGQLDLYEYYRIEKQVNSSSSEPIPKEKDLPKNLRDGLNKLLMIVKRFEDIRQSITSKKGTTQRDSFVDLLIVESHVPRPVIKLALSDISRLIEMLDSNFEECTYRKLFEQLKDVVIYHIQALIRNVNFDYLAQSMQLLDMLQAASLQLGLFDPREFASTEVYDLLDPVELDHTKVQGRFAPDAFDYTQKQFSSSCSIPLENFKSKLKEETEPILFKPFDPNEFDHTKMQNPFDPDEYGHAEKHVSSSYSDPLEKFKPKLTEELGPILSKPFDPYEFDRTKMQNPFDPDEYGHTEKLVSSSYSDPLEKFKPKLTEESGPILSKSHLRIGLEKLLQFMEAEKKHSFISYRKGTRQAQANTITPTLKIGVEKWLKFVEQFEKERPFITSKKGTTHPQPYNITPLNTTFFPSRGFFSTTSLENVKCQEDAVGIMQNHKKNLIGFVFGWTDTTSRTDTCKTVLETLEPDRNLESLSIICYSCAKFPNWMAKKNWLPHLQTLELRSCRNLKIVPFLPPRLRKLQVENCHELMQLPFVGDTLHTLYLFDCPKLILPLRFNKPLGLSDVRITNCLCNETPFFIDISFLTNLKLLELARVPKLQALTNLSHTMTDLVIKDCAMLTSLENLQRCTSLERLSILKCPMLRREEPSLVEGVVERNITIRLPQVTYVHTDDSLLVLDLVQQQAFSSITALNLRDCAALPNMEKLSSLKHLQIEDCPNAESLPNLPVSLRLLWIYKCPKMKEKYEEGGRLRNTISHIPRIFVL